MTNKKICLKCLEMSLGYFEHCMDCGKKLVEFTLACECGAKISPFFGYRVFPPWGRQLRNKYCPSCGRDIRKPVKDYLRELRVGVRGSHYY